LGHDVGERHFCRTTKSHCFQPQKEGRREGKISTQQLMIIKKVALILMRRIPIFGCKEGGIQGREKEKTVAYVQLHAQGNGIVCRYLSPSEKNGRP